MVELTLPRHAAQACPLNASPCCSPGTSRQQAWEEFSRCFTPAVKEVVEFAKSIPGFQGLCQQDQVMLLKAGTFQVCVSVFVCVNALPLAGGIQLCVRAHMCVCMLPCWREPALLCACVCTCVCMHALPHAGGIWPCSLCVQAHVFVCMHVHVCACMFMCMCVQGSSSVCICTPPYLVLWVSSPPPAQTGFLSLAACSQPPSELLGPRGLAPVLPAGALPALCQAGQGRAH